MMKMIKTKTQFIIDLHVSVYIQWGKFRSICGTDILLIYWVCERVRECVRVCVCVLGGVCHFGAGIFVSGLNILSATATQPDIYLFKTMSLNSVLKNNILQQCILLWQPISIFFNSLKHNYLFQELSGTMCFLI